MQDRSFPLCYETIGNPHDPCIILIMGIGGQLIDWPQKLTQGLADNGFYVVTFDNRDSGLSKHFDELGAPNFNDAIVAKQQGKIFKPPYSLEDVAADVNTLMNELRVEKSHILGISMGGMIAQLVALNYPDRVLSLTCISSTSGDPALPPPTKEVMDFFSSSAEGQKNQTMESFVNKKLELFKIYNPNFFEEEKAKRQMIASYQRANDPIGFQRLMLAVACAEPRMERLKKLNVPSLIIHGDCDPVFNLAHGKQLAALIPGSQFELIEKMGHGLSDVACEKIIELFVKYFKKIKRLCP